MFPSSILQGLCQPPVFFFKPGVFVAMTGRRSNRAVGLAGVPIQRLDAPDHRVPEGLENVSIRDHWSMASKWYLICLVNILQQIR